MACFRGKITAACFCGLLTPFESIEGTVTPFSEVSGQLAVICPVNVAGPHSLCLDNGEELWCDDDMPFDFE